MQINGKHSIHTCYINDNSDYCVSLTEKMGYPGAHNVDTGSEQKWEYPDYDSSPGYSLLSHMLFTNFESLMPMFVTSSENSMQIMKLYQLI